MDILNNLNLHRNKLQNAVAQNLIAAPVNPIQGLFYFDTNSRKLLYYNGTHWVYAGDDDTTYTFAEGEANGQIKVTDSNGKKMNVSVKGLAAAAYKNVDASIPVGSASANVPTSAAVAAAISTGMATVDAMCYKGTLGSGGKYAALPTDNIKAGDTYRVITAGTYAGLSAKVGDLIIVEAETLEWGLVPSGDDGNAYKYTAVKLQLNDTHWCIARPRRGSLLFFWGSCHTDFSLKVGKSTVMSKCIGRTNFCGWAGGRRRGDGAVP